MIRVLALFLIGFFPFHASAANVETTDYIASPQHFNGFEAISVATFSYGDSHAEDGIQVQQVNGDGNGIWTTYLTPTDPFGYTGTFQGLRSWYPSSGDYGYTRITTTDGSPFGNIGFQVGSGNGYNTLPAQAIFLYYELVNDGVVVQSDTIGSAWTPHWLGFSGGGFDEVRLRDSQNSISSLSSGDLNALAIDSIKVAAVPEPQAWLLMSLGLFAVGAIAKRRRG